MSEEKKAADENEPTPAVEPKKRMPQDAIDRINRALEAGKTPSEMENEIYRKMFM